MRETPQNIDRSVKFMEYGMAFLIPAILCFPLAQLWAIPIGMVACGLTVHFSAGKPPGFMEEWLYNIGVPLPELLPPKLLRLDR